LWRRLNTPEADVYRLPFLDVFTGEQVAEEVVRTLVGSIGLVLAVPLTTLIAAWTAAAGTAEPAPQGHSHVNVDA
jgi:uncharacterized membrane protein